MPYHDFASTMRGGEIPRGTDAQLLQAAHHLVDLFLIHIREHEMGGDLFDTEELPVGKEALINAFRVVIATESRPGVRALLVKAGMRLAQFQDNVGPRISVRPAIHGFRAQAGQTQAGNAGSRRPAASELRRFDKALMQLGKDQNRLVHIFRHASEIAEHKPRQDA
ncbi:hypothetical protein [Neorhizobium sp. NCHU2750]|uniref:hypothetical protein n=1 Tax=Neorhizobium sp. NCHU2750 TaxID=1825976 RepID=UPI000E74BDB1|nr:hypothetical protein NCHU2750_03290 [Neorhizobium sp. NCHU2750]